MAANPQDRSPILGSRWLTALTLASVVFVLAILGSLQYSGLINAMGEWQFARLGFYLPMISVLAWVGLTGLVLWLIARILFRRGEEQELPLAAMRQRGTLLRNAMLALGFVAGLVALAGAINLVLLPPADGRERLVTPATLGPSAAGAVRLRGFRVAGPMARYSEGVLVWKNDIFLVPLSAGRDAAGAGPIRLFAQVSPYEAATRVPDSYRGILRPAALPKELYPLYAGRGKVVEDNAAVLYRDSFSMALSTLLLIGEATVVAIAAFITAFVIHRRRRQLRQAAS